MEWRSHDLPGVYSCFRQYLTCPGAGYDGQCYTGGRGCRSPLVLLGGRFAWQSCCGCHVSRYAVCGYQQQGRGRGHQGGVLPGSLFYSRGFLCPLIIMGIACPGVIVGVSYF